MEYDILRFVLKMTLILKLIYYVTLYHAHSNYDTGKTFDLKMESEYQSPHAVVMINIKKFSLSRSDLRTQAAEGTIYIFITLNVFHLSILFLNL